MYNKQQIMSRAWSLFKMAKRWVGQKTFAQCLRQAWAEAKAEVADNAELDRLRRLLPGRPDLLRPQGHQGRRFPLGLRGPPVVHRQQGHRPQLPACLIIFPRNRIFLLTTHALRAIL